MLNENRECMAVDQTWNEEEQVGDEMLSIGLNSLHVFSVSYSIRYKLLESFSSFFNKAEKKWSEKEKRNEKKMVILLWK